MTQRSRLAKVVVVLSSALLAGGYVLYQSRGESPPAGKVLSGSKSRAVFTPTTSTAPATAPESSITATTQPENFKVFSGSKSGAVFTPRDAPAPVATTLPTTQP